MLTFRVSDTPKKKRNAGPFVGSARMKSPFFQDPTPQSKGSRERVDTTIIEYLWGSSFVKFYVGDRR